MRDYTTRQLTRSDLLDKSLMGFIKETGDFVNDLYGKPYDWDNFPILIYIDNHYFKICFRGFEPVGLMIGSLNKGVFDLSKKTLRQVLLFALPNTRAAHYLMKDFIDFGKVNANHTITTLNSNTNIKPETLEKLGFKKLEVLYRMENK